MGRAANTERRARHILQLRHAARCGEPVRAELQPVIDDLRAELDETVPKASAARVLGVSTTTLDKWVARGLIPTAPAPKGSHRELPRDALLDLAEEVAEIRRLGADRHVLSEALRRLHANDPETRASFERDLGPALAAAQRGELVKFTLPDDWDPED